MKHAPFFMAGVLLTIAAGCSPAAIPQQRVLATDAAIQAASEVGTGESPQAALHLKLAREQSAHAKMLMNTGDSQRALLMLQRAEADARLSLALSRESKARQEAQAALQQVQTLQEQAAQ